MSITMKKSDDPATLFEKIAAIENQYTALARHAGSATNVTIDEDDILGVIIDTAPEEYQAVINSELRLQGTALTREHLETAMTSYYRVLSRTKGWKTSTGETKEVSLATVGSNFIGKCWDCGKQGVKKGHPGCTKSNTTNGNDNGGQHKCKHCGKVHPKTKDDDCWSIDKNKDKRPKWYGKKQSNNEQSTPAIDTDETVEYLMMATESELGLKVHKAFAGGNKMTVPNNAATLLDPDIWIADSGATVHSTPHKFGMHAIKKATNKDGLTMGNGSVEQASILGDIKGDMCDKHGNILQAGKLNEVTHCATGKFNLFSVTKLMKHGWTLGGDHNSIWLTKGDQRIVFDIKVDTPKGVIYCMYFKRKDTTAIRETSHATTDGVTMNIMQAHRRLGHANEDAIRKTCKHLGWKLVRGSMQVCTACTAAKAKRKNIPKHDNPNPSKAPGERMYIDQSRLTGDDKTHITDPNWCMLVDEHSQLKFSSFHATKDGQVQPKCEQFNLFKLQGKPVKYLRMDNAGENKALEQAMNGKDWKLNIWPEYTARDTPQQNHLAELSIASIAAKARALMNDANVPLSVRRIVGKKAIKTATDLDGLVVTTRNGKTATRYEHFGQQLPAFTNL